MLLKPTLIVMTAAIFGSAVMLEAQQVSPVVSAEAREHNAELRMISANRSEIKSLDRKLAAAKSVQRHDLALARPDSVTVANDRWQVELLQHKIAMSEDRLAVEERKAGEPVS